MSLKPVFNAQQLSDIYAGNGAVSTITDVNGMSAYRVINYTGASIGIYDDQNVLIDSIPAWCDVTDNIDANKTTSLTFVVVKGAALVNIAAFAEDQTSVQYDTYGVSVLQNKQQLVLPVSQVTSVDVNNFPTNYPVTNYGTTKLLVEEPGPSSTISNGLILSSGGTVYGNTFTPSQMVLFGVDFSYFTYGSTSGTLYSDVLYLVIQGQTTLTGKLLRGVASAYLGKNTFNYAEFVTFSSPIDLTTMFPSDSSFKIGVNWAGGVVSGSVISSQAYGAVTPLYL